MSLERLPGTLLRLEGAALGGAAIALYVHQGFGALAFVLLILAPDVSMLGYVAGDRAGAALYDLVHFEGMAGGARHRRRAE